MNEHQVKIDTNKCIGCGFCIKTCAAHNIKLNSNKAETIFNDCIMCGQCAAICPKSAISIHGFEQEISQKHEIAVLNPQQVLDVIRFRRSIRHFKDKKIPNEILDQILEAGRLTHTAKNRQDVSFIVLDKEKDVLESMAVKLFRKLKPIANVFSTMTRHNEINNHFFFFQAPIVIVILAEDKVNGLLAAQNMEFVAEANGLGVLFSGFFTTAANTSIKIKKALAIPKKKKVAMTLVLGYPDINYLRPAPRKEKQVKYM